MLNNRGKYVASLQKIVKWLGEKAEEAGAQVFPAFPGQELLWDGERVIGVRTGDKGLDKNGNPKPNYEPGADILAKIVVLGEGPRGTLVKQAMPRLKSRCRARAASLRRRHKRALAMSARTRAARERDSHAGLSVAGRNIRRRLRLRNAGGHSRRRIHHGAWITATRQPIRRMSCSVSNCIRPCARCCKTPRSFATAPRQFPKADSSRCRGCIVTACSSLETRPAF